MPDFSNDILLCMMDDDFHAIMESDPILNQLESEKYNPRDEFFELMMVLSKTFTIDNVVVSCFTPAIWSYLFCIGSPYTTNAEAKELDTDIVLYVLHNGIRTIDKDIVEKASGFCRKHDMNPEQAEKDIRALVYLSFRPLEMLAQTSNDTPRFDVDWLTHIVSIVCPLTGKTSDDVIYDMSLCECFSYLVQKAREFDVNYQIRRRNTAEINGAIYERTMELGKQYYEKNYGGNNA